MVVDTSAILAIIFNEEEAQAFSRKIADTEERYISAATLLEATVALCRQTKSRDDRDLLNFLAAISPTIGLFDEAQYLIAREASRFGRGSGHPAQSSRLFRLCPR